MRQWLIKAPDVEVGYLEPIGRALGTNIAVDSDINMVGWQLLPLPGAPSVGPKKPVGVGLLCPAQADAAGDAAWPDRAGTTGMNPPWRTRLANITRVWR